MTIGSHLQLMFMSFLSFSSYKVFFNVLLFLCDFCHFFYPKCIVESDRNILSDYDVHKNVNLCTLTLNVDHFM